MSKILNKIFTDKKEELVETRRRRPLLELKNLVSEQQPCKNVINALNPSQCNSSRIIAELKSRTPFRGEIRTNFDPVSIARDYADNGAAIISILTESRYFGGNLDYLVDVRARVDIPLLRKDFIFDEYQVFESRAFGGDLFLLIAMSLEIHHLEDLMALGDELGLLALVETHNEYDMEKAFRIGARIIGINNRDLTNGKTDLNISRRLLKMNGIKSDMIIVCESGITTRTEIVEFEKLGVHAFLIGESLMKTDDIPAKLKNLQGQGVNAG